MNILCRMLSILASFLWMSGVARAQNLSLVWSEWETSEVQKQGPEVAEGILLYFQRSPSGNASKEPMASIFVEMAKGAPWDVLRINRHPFADGEESDDDILQVVADRVARARLQGYRKVVLGGAGRGGWLALWAAGLPGVDAAIGLAPGRAYEPTVLALARDDLAGRLAQVGATRIAVFFFEDDPVTGRNAGWSGRLARRYRDCLLRLVGEIAPPAGEVRCSPTTGYAVGSDIGVPVSVDPPRLANAIRL